MFAAALPQQMASSSSSCRTYGHFICRDCMRQYVVGKVQERNYPICCTAPSCGEELAHEDMLLLLGDTSRELEVYEALVTEQSIDHTRRAYCPYKDCSCLLERPEPGEDGHEDGQGGQMAPFECPLCHRRFCLSCGIAGWHTGMTCGQFQALPPELRSVEDAATLAMAREKSWKQCPAPGCGHLVERTEGCNHMKCRCGCAFCYQCGAAYRDKAPTANNVHGTPTCTCPLFPVPEDLDEPAAGGAGGDRPVVLRQYGAPAPWRSGRRVSHTRCRHSASIYNCPHGPDRCWFWHDEDEEV